MAGARISSGEGLAHGEIGGTGRRRGQKKIAIHATVRSLQLPDFSLIVGYTGIKVDQSSPEVKVLLPGLVGSVSAFQFAEDDRRQDGKSAKDKKCFVQAVNHLARVRTGAGGNEQRRGQSCRQVEDGRKGRVVCPRLVRRQAGYL
jgi:hypothetical protein